MKEEQVREVFIDYIVRHEPVTLTCCEEKYVELQKMTTAQLKALFMERRLVEYCIYHQGEMKVRLL